MKPTTSSADLEVRWSQIKLRILAASSHLWTQGNICRKWERGGYIWRLRYYEHLASGELRQRTIRIGRDAELVHRAAELLKRCRQGKELLDEVRPLARLVRAAAKEGHRVSVQWVGLSSPRH